MEDKRVMEILTTHLGDKVLGEAVLATRRQISNEVLLDIAPELGNDKNKLDTFDQVNNALGRIAYFLSDSDIIITRFDLAEYVHLISLYKALRSGLQYLDDRYDQIDLEAFKKGTPRESLKNVIALADSKIHDLSEFFASSGVVIMSQ